MVRTTVAEHEAYRQGYAAGQAHVAEVDRRVAKPRWALGAGTFAAGLVTVAAIVASRRTDDTGDIFAGFAIVAGVGVAMAGGLKVLFGQETDVWGF